MKPAKPPLLQAKAPAKLILSGEHAIVYGAPALGMALMEYATTTSLSFHQNNQILLQLQDLKAECIFNQETLTTLKHTIDQRYQSFLNQTLNLAEVFRPADLLPYALAYYADQYNISYPGIYIQVTSTIPKTSGLGTSAACIVSLLRVLSTAFRQIEPEDVFVALAQKIENLAHGKSSGFDVQLVFHGDCLFYEKGHYFTCPTPNFPFQLVDTGAPIFGTAACVQAAAPIFKHSKTLLSEFSEVTHALMNAIKKQNLSEILRNIAINHRLLCDIGVIPDKVQHCIAKIEKRGNAAKICGAGSYHGENAGVLLVVGNEPITDILAAYDYPVLIHRGELHG